MVWNIVAIGSIIIISMVDIMHSLDLSCKNNIAIYWGQNSFGGRHLNEKQLWEKDLRHYCSPSSINSNADVIMLSFLNVFNADNKKLPEINLANHCEDLFNETEANYVRKCYGIGEDIKYCQKNNKKILLSLGGAVGSAGFNSAESAKQFSKTIWNMFLGGEHKFRPFNDAVLDGIDLDIEGGSNLFYEDFVKELRALFSKSNKKYYVSAAPQCVFPDHSLNNVISNSDLDMLFIQYYNNWCGVQNFDNRFAWNFEDWTKFTANKKTKIFLGVPASLSAASGGYVDYERLETIINNVTLYDKFAGVMFWDASQAQNNLVGPNDEPYDRVIKQYLDANYGSCNKNGGQPGKSSVVHPPTKTHYSETSSSFPTYSSDPYSSPHTTKTTSSSEDGPTSKATTSSQNSNPQPIQTNVPGGLCPVEGMSCAVDGSYECNGNLIGVCHNGKDLIYNRQVVNEPMFLRNVL